MQLYNHRSSKKEFGIQHITKLFGGNEATRLLGRIYQRHLSSLPEQQLAEGYGRVDVVQI
jgi:hypothetical protein